MVCVCCVVCVKGIVTKYPATVSVIMTKMKSQSRIKQWRQTIMHITFTATIK